MKKMICGIVTLIMLLILICTSTGFSEENAVVVHNINELRDAINEQKANRILISKKFKYGKAITIKKENKIEEEIRSALDPEGRNIVIAAESEDGAVIDGTIQVSGSGTVVFDNVNIQAQQSEIGLYVTDNVEVTIDSVRGGDSNANQGGTAVRIDDDAILHINSAIGGKSRNGMAGDGIQADDDSKVYVCEATGGNCENGVGGAGIVVFGNASVTVTESAIGGDGAVCAGKAILIGGNGQTYGSAERQDGKKLENKKAPDPEKINSYALLENALRNGKTEIRLDPSYHDGRSVVHMGSFFTAGEETVRIRGAYDGKLQKIDGGLRINGGNWEITGLDISVKNDWALIVTNGANVRFEGALTSTGNHIATINVRTEASLEMIGDVSAYGQRCNAVFVDGSGTLKMTGNVLSPNYIAVFMDTGNIVLNGTITMKTNKQYAVIGYNGEIEIIGSIKAPYPYYADSTCHITITEP